MPPRLIASDAPEPTMMFEPEMSPVAPPKPICSVPAAMFVSPVYVLLPARVMVPVPVLEIATLPAPSAMRPK